MASFSSFSSLPHRPDLGLILQRASKAACSRLVSRIRSQRSMADLPIITPKVGTEVKHCETCERHLSCSRMAIVFQQPGKPFTVRAKDH